MLTGGLAEHVVYRPADDRDVLRPEDILGLGILIDQIGSYFVPSTLGILVAFALYSAGHGINVKRGGSKDRPLRAFSGVRGGVAADAILVVAVAL